MKIIFKKILQGYLKCITKLVLVIHKPTIIAIAGSTNKTFVKDKINDLLKKQGIKSRSNPKSFNTEIGLPLSILGLQSGYNSYKNWLPAIINAPLAIFKKKDYKVLVLELGVSDPGDMKFLLSIVKPTISIVTDITQRYMESFSDMDQMVKEYEYLSENTSKSGLLILNYDNLRVRGIGKTAKCKVEYFGFEKGADWQVTETRKENFGQTAIIANKNRISEYKIEKFGKHHIYSLLVSLIIEDYVKKENNKLQR